MVISMKYEKKYEPGLKLLLVIVPLASMSVFYYILKRSHRKSIITLAETSPFVQWSYSEFYWRNFKDKEFREKGLVYVVKLLLNWCPIVALLLVVAAAEPVVAIIVSIYLLIYTVPLIPFTLGEFLREMKNQLFQDEFDVKIYKNGLTINDVYCLYNHCYSKGNNVKLVKIEKLSLYSTDCIKFTARKQFYSSPTLDGGDSGSLINRSTNKLIPIPKNCEKDMITIQKQLGL